MNKKVMIGLLVAMASGSVQADYLESREIKKQFSDQTVTMVELKKNVDVSLHYASDGVLTGLRGKKQINGTWKVDGKDQLCVNYGKKDICRKVSRKDGKVELTRVKKNGEATTIAKVNAFSKGK